MQTEPFFAFDGEHYQPLTLARGPWGRGKSINGRVIVGLLGHEIERLFGGEEFLPVRLTVDMYRLAAFAPLQVVVRPLREGLRIKVIEAELISDGVSAARAVCQILRRGEEPDLPLWSQEPWRVPHPDELTSDVGGLAELSDLRPIGQGLRGDGPRRLWMAETRELVEGRPLTPYTRVAMGVDIASPMTNGGAAGLPFINTDMTLHLHREPRGKWIGYEARVHGSAAGISTGACLLYDLDGPIGMASCAALGNMELVNRRGRPGG